VSVWTPLADPVIRARWFDWPNLLYLAPVPLLVAAVAWRGHRGLVRREEVSPWLCANLLFLLGFVGLGSSFYPYVIPGELTIWQAAAPDESLLFMLVGAAVLLPLILTYTAYAYWVFRGKTNVDEAYH
jgi:cytochrome bd ubiquinol oxidase subunit II